MVKTYILDFDGTMGDTRSLIVKTMQQTLAELGLPERTDDQCAAMIDSGAVDGKMNAVAKTFSSEAAMQNTLDAVQIFSGYGYSREYEVKN